MESDQRLGHCFVTGAAGFIGSHLVRELSSRATDVVALDNLQAGRWSEAHEGTNQVTCDLTEESVESLEEMLEGSSVLFHLAAEKYNSSRADPERVLDVNVLATHRLFEAAARVGARVVFTSSLYAYGRTQLPAMVETDVPQPRTYYGLSKLAGEHILRTLGVTSGLSWSVARVFFIYGTGQHAGSGYKSVIVKNFSRLRAGEAPIVHGSGTQALDYTYVSDAVAALIELASNRAGGEVFNVSSGQPTSVNELTAMMLAAAGESSEPVHDEPDWTEGSVRLGDPTKIKLALDWQANTPWSEGLKHVATEFLA